MEACFLNMQQSSFFLSALVYIKHKKKEEKLEPVAFFIMRILQVVNSHDPGIFSMNSSHRKQCQTARTSSCLLLKHLSGRFDLAFVFGLFNASNFNSYSSDSIRHKTQRIQDWNMLLHFYTTDKQLKASYSPGIRIWKFITEKWWKNWNK